nr:serine carboxypeptidase-like [Ipomoea batatas]
MWPFLLVLVLVSSPGQANGDDNSMAKRRAEKMIRQLNLFPLHDLNRGSGHSPAETDSPRLVEKQLKLKVLGDSGAIVEDLGHHAGYYRLPDTVDARMFYFFFESRSNKSDPVVIWLTGGPGCSGSLALFYENGPFYIADNHSLIWNDYGWDKEFFKAHPEYAKNEFFVTGESYAGHYIPALGTRINQGNKKKEGIYINLKGLAIGNGLTNPEIQYPAYPDYALDNNLISKSYHDELIQLIPDCQKAVRMCNSNGGSACGDVYYDIRKKCLGGSLCYDLSNAETFLNTQSVKDALGVGDIDWVSCSSTVSLAMAYDWFKNLAVGIPSLLEDGNLRWVRALQWSGHKGFRAAPNVKFLVDGKEKGIQKNYGPLTFLKVHDAGHLVPMDQPKASLEMIRRWMKGQLTKL